jgi:nickel/cobalt transporter (NiCoT) family protein
MATTEVRRKRLREALTPPEWRQLSGMAAAVLGLNVLGWGMLAAALRGHYHLNRTELFGTGTGILAFTLGARHAFDADHIAAIDNTTRKLVGEGKRPLTTGFWFSLGHSSVVFALAMLLNFGVRALGAQVRNGNSPLHGTTEIIGTGVSGTFLYVIAALNVVILAGIVKVFRDMRSGRFSDEELEEQLAKRGLMNRLLRPLARRVDTPWKMYPIGVLFGLGFDTATEIALLVLAGSAVVGGLPFYAVLSLPILFAAGMSLFDSADSCFMNFAYDWAFARPIRKVYYNLTITGLSVLIAFFIGTVEVLGLVAQQAHLNGGFWDFMANFNLNTAGYVIVALFALTWIAAAAVWHFGRFEQRWATAPGCARDLPGGREYPGRAQAYGPGVRPRLARSGRQPTAGHRRAARRSGASAARAAPPARSAASSRVLRPAGRSCCGCSACTRQHSFPRRGRRPGCAESRGRSFRPAARSKRTGSYPGA